VGALLRLSACTDPSANALGANVNMRPAYPTGNMLSANASGAFPSPDDNVFGTNATVEVCAL
jgi:hypothetical protein